MWNLLLEEIRMAIHLATSTAKSKTHFEPQLSLKRVLIDSYRRKRKAERRERETVTSEELGDTRDYGVIEGRMAVKSSQRFKGQC